MICRCLATPSKSSQTMTSSILVSPALSNRPTMGDLMRHKGADWATRYIQRRYGIRRRLLTLWSACWG
jgi:hypothetical protein